MKVLVTGGYGMLGQTIKKKLTDFEIIQTDREADITDADMFERAVKTIKPDAVIHCAAMTDVDACELNPTLAYKVNTFGTLNVAKICNKYGIRLIAISTDYVFSGEAPCTPYNEYDSSLEPVNVYGRSKLAGEEAIRICCPNHVICRTAWLYGEFGKNSNFVNFVLRITKTNPYVNVLEKQWGNPTSTLAVARQLRFILNTPRLNGTYHTVCEAKDVSWRVFAKEILRLSKREAEICYITPEVLHRKANRPMDTTLDNMHFRIEEAPPMPNWKDSLAEYINTLKNSEFSEKFF